MFSTKNGKYKILEKLGNGAFGTVYKVQCNLSGQVYAMKEILSRTKITPEIVILRNINHRNIIQYIETVIKDTSHAQIFSLSIVMEFADRGILSKPDNRSIITSSELNIWKFLQQMASALNCVHDKGVIHRDLKPDNILCATVIRNGSVVFKIADFGIACVLATAAGDRQYAGTKIGYCGSYCYIAPENLNESHHYTYSADLWSLGAVMSYVCNDGRHLFSNDADVLNWQGGRSTLPTQYLFELRAVVANLLDPNYSKRFPASAIDCICKKHIPPGNNYLATEMRMNEHLEQSCAVM